MQAKPSAHQGSDRSPDRAEWVLLAYRIPREPSTPRISVWRRLRRIGAGQILDGLVALPAGVQTREQLEWVAEEVLQAGGDAQLWIGNPASAAQEEALKERMAETIAAEYRELVGDAARAGAEDEAGRVRALRRLRRELHRIRQRDYFPPPEKDEAVRAVTGLAESLETAL
ncbi:Chromate resistance protein ChrB [Arthrobacter sp. Soil736]|uniref:Chromate resistance protein ChrB n=1 Tax=Arthrobacter sp. Soil736 TaxID=1736395 RepID=UPI0019101068|nr:Chromate resistance protein ChrB [Arthrobacter sp. Soil736]